MWLVTPEIMLGYARSHGENRSRPAESHGAAAGCTSSAARRLFTMTEFDGLPLLRSPVAIAAFEGWNDAADASTAAVEHLEQVWEAREISAIDPEDFYDFQVSRP